MKAVPYGKDGLTGDSSFYPSEEEAVDATEESKFEDLLKVWTAKRIAEEGIVEIDGVLCEPTDPPFKWEVDYPVGFWLMREEDLETALIPGEVECHNDGQCYTVNRVIKTLCRRLAVKLIVPPA